MTLFNILGITDALAAGTTNAGANGGMASFLPMIFVFFIGAYFLMIRPQNKRVKAHRKLMSELSKGDEVITAGGLLGKISKLHDDFVTVSVAENVDINIQKTSISTVLPKGTIKSIE